MLVRMTASASRIGLPAAVGIGIGSMLGAGVFAVWGPVAVAAGEFMIVAVILAAAIAACNALSTAQMASLHPHAGGAYTYGMREVNPAMGYVAGLGYVVGKTASIATMGLAIGLYVWPSHASWVATGAIVVSWVLNARGITRTAWAASAVGAVVVIALLAFVGAGFTQPAASDAFLTTGAWWEGAGGIGAGAALMFFAYAGYARIATLGEEVRDPERTVPRAIIWSLAAVLGIYLVLAFALQRRLGPEALAQSQAPLNDLTQGTFVPGAVVSVIAAVAAFGAMVALTAGVGRTAMAMAREGDLPRGIAVTNSRKVPQRAEALTSLVAIALAWIADLGFALAMSSFAVLVYYAVANLAAMRSRKKRRVGPFVAPRWVPWVGLIGSVAVALWLPVMAALFAIVLGLLALLVRWFANWLGTTRAALAEAKQKEAARASSDADGSTSN